MLQQRELTNTARYNNGNLITHANPIIRWFGRCWHGSVWRRRRKCTHAVIIMTVSCLKTRIREQQQQQRHTQTIGNKNNDIFWNKRRQQQTKEQNKEKQTNEQWNYGNNKNNSTRIQLLPTTTTSPKKSMGEPKFVHCKDLILARTFFAKNDDDCCCCRRGGVLFWCWCFALNNNNDTNSSKALDSNSENPTRRTSGSGTPTLGHHQNVHYYYIGKNAKYYLASTSKSWPSTKMGLS